MKNLRIFKEPIYGERGFHGHKIKVYRDHEPHELKIPITEGLRNLGRFVIEAASMEIAEKFIKDNS